MDNFYFVNVKPAIDRKETATIKDAIFKRAKEKAESLTEEKSENYTSQIQQDVMEVARETLKPSSLNPFNQFKENTKIQTDEQEVVDAIDKVKPQSELEIPREEKIYTNELKHNIESVSDKAYSNTMKEEAMSAARTQFRNNLNTTLNFLNTQAAIQMAKNARSKIRFVSYN